MKNFSKFVFGLSILSLTSIVHAIELDYKSIGVTTGGHFNEKPIEKGTGNSATTSLDGEIAVKITEKINAVAGMGIGYENKKQNVDINMDNGSIEQFSRTDTKAQFSAGIGATYKINDEIAVGAGYKQYIGEQKDASREAIAALVRYKLKFTDTAGLTINAELEKNLTDKGYGFKVGVSASAF